MVGCCGACLVLYLHLSGPDTYHTGCCNEQSPICIDTVYPIADSLNLVTTKTGRVWKNILESSWSHLLHEPHEHVL